MIVNVELPPAEPGVTVAGEKVTFDPAGAPEAESVTLSGNGPALVGAMVTV